ncbi:universal stress protein [Tenacibaculum sp. IB213877]|uniref:universal stress protein n=1 Tax=Tenacibaculum sp. IB213877 TaxID=3097351 RepID=UPI002A5B07EF|nr:universal stress protein [Tenacibaculum sp. IB213877]MDY0780960.1 universal stress protein [Tenacibaculum sp. IB213877]
MKRILFATDYSENTVSGLKYACNLSEKLNASLFVIYVSKKKSDKSHEVELENFCREHYDLDLDKLDISFEVIESNSIEKGITNKAKELNADVIITGSKSEKLIKELLLGSTIKHLIDKAPCPVLMVPKKAKVREIKTFVYASDFEESDIKAIDKLLKLVKPFNAMLKIVHFSKDENIEEEKMEWFKELLREKISYDKIETDVLISDNIFNNLRYYLGKNKADIAVMLERKPRKLVKKLFHADLVKKMGTLSNFPLMSFNETNL